ncbi:MAG: ATP-binding protein [Aeromonas veronii]
MRKLFIFWLCIVLSATAKSNVSDTSLNRIPILSRESVPTGSLGEVFNETEQAWLHSKKKLVLAVPAPDNPPLDISLISGQYEGVTADVVGLLSSTLGIPIIARRYESRSAALHAIRVGDADLLGASNAYEQFQGLLLTKPYINDTPVIFIRQGIQLQDIESVAVPQDYLPDELFKSLFHGKKIIHYSGRYSALASVAYKRTDAVLIDLLSGNYLVNKFYLDSIDFGKVIPFNSYGFSFAISPNNKTLESVINRAIDIIPLMSINSIYERWSSGGLSLQDDSIKLTAYQKEYLATKKEITLAVNYRIPPMGFVDQYGHFRGMLADLIQAIKLRLGVEVKLVIMDDPLKQLEAVESGMVDVTVASPNRRHSQKLIFGRQFVHDKLVYVIRKENHDKYPDATTALNDGIFALVKNSVAEKFIDENQTDKYRYTYFDKYDNALACVTNRLCVAAIVPLRSALYFINSNQNDQLEVGGELYESQPVAAAFATRIGNRELIDILDAVLSSIPPNELEVLSNRWRVSAQQEKLTIDDVFHQFWLEMMVTTITLLILISWALFLRKQNDERNRAQLELKQQLKFMDDLIDSIPHPIFARNKDNIFTLCNKSYCNFVGLSKDQVIGTSIVDLPMTKQSHEQLLDIYRRLYEDGTSYSGDHFVTFLDGRTYNIYYWLHIYNNLSDEIGGIIGGWLDISDRHRLMEELAEASQRAEYANRAKTKFLATMSHEIRTPMNAIIGLLELTLRKGAVSAQAYESIGIALKSATELLGLIGDILDISKIESGKLELSPSPNSIAELSNSVINVFMANAREKGLFLTSSIESDRSVLIDSMRYKQIISNLISNAIKFTKKGGVYLNVTSLTEDSDCLVSIKVSDTGIGISQDDQARLFQPFSQAEHLQDEYRSGTGLGLLICRTLCEMMGGHLELVSEKGVGTTITVLLRVPIVSPELIEPVILPEIAVKQPQTTRVSNILIIDDHPTNRLLVTQQLTFLGHEVTAAESGRDALLLLAEQRFDFIITDFNMPDINGLDFTARYRQQECDEQRERTIIIGLTADARKEQIQHAMEVGMDDCLFKPVSLDEIRDCLAAHDRGPMLYVHSSETKIATRIDQMLGGLADNKTELMYTLIQEFLKATDDDIAILSLACSDEDSRRFLDHLHRIKGGARIIGADHLVECCSEWERSSRLTWCMPSALRQLENIYCEVKEGILYWKKMRGINEQW